MHQNKPSEIYTSATAAEDYKRIAAAIHYLERHRAEQPTLEDLAAYLHLSPYHVQRLFKRWAGISPKRFLQFLTLEHARELLTSSHSLLETTYATGLSSPSRLHDLFVTLTAVSPAEFRNGGEGITISYGFHPCPFGECLLAQTERGVCGLHFVTAADRTAALAELRTHWPNAKLVEDTAGTAPTAAIIFPPNPRHGRRELNLHIRGTNFQLKVWEALLRIPPAAVCTYGDIAEAIGQPSAARAVGTAIGRNPIGYIIPCHRVIRQSGLMDNYRWGGVRKKAILGWEAAHAEVMPTPA